MPLSRIHPRRSGFTLVELIVVITIISILAALITGAVILTRGTANDAKVTAEMQQISMAIENFKSKNGVGYLPSRFVLRNRVDTYVMTNPLEKASKDYLLKLFPRINQTANHGWVRAAPTNQNARVELNGCECLVFFLGGPDGLTGFTKNSSALYDPTKKNEVALDFGSFGTRLKEGVFNPMVPVLLDPFAEGAADDQPYFYFSSKYGDDYDATHAVAINTPTVKFNVAPFFLKDPNNPNSPRNGFANARSFQLICAGKDKRPGNFVLSTVNDRSLGCVVWYAGAFPLGVVNPANNPQIAAEPFDNVSNFYEKKLGVP